MKVYRYEHNQYHTGPYQSYDYNKVSDLLNAVHDPYEHPDHKSWQRDRNLRRLQWKKNYWAATESIESLNEWFEGYQDKLQLAGYVVAEYEVPDHAVIFSEDNRQVAFDSEEIKSRQVVVDAME